MQGTKYRKSLGVVAKRPNGVPLQCKQYNTEATAPAKAHKPKLYGWHNPRNAKPSKCVVTNGSGVIIRIVQSVRVR